ncbi:hypothetical protein [Blastococcus sp. CT_GayMR20]|uniref:hypothetical protein n=1 Tax=Blastococcus sp. CT_GayMR20 TaxID=2559609 RepID=UPI001ADD9A25|nr:hypothetical protein [Blastococcus sp. CT_GayMR20]
MDTWVIVLIVVVVVVLLALLALALSKRSRVANLKKREQAREHLQEAQVLSARADKDQALAEEQAARARRERAEAEERTALAEQEARERAARAGEQAKEAEQLRARAEKLAPDMGRDHRAHDGATLDGRIPDGPGHTVNPDQPGGGGATRR